ncbi:Ribosomal protein S12 methylthiotransferase RimO [Methylibium sp. T29-B]|nr:Ribosomal protein S12 methylthiotransferase RimO [Methylibium sp. T29-B]
MTQTADAASTALTSGDAASRNIPKIGFVSLGCPKALTDSELILTQLRAEGYDTSKSFAGADLVIVNTCGFIDDAVKESLDTIGEALAENGRVIVTGCLGAKAGEGGGNLVRQMHPSVLAVTGPHATQEVMDAVHVHVPKPHDPFVDLVPAYGVKLTPRHYAYLKISEGCNHRCSFCIIPSMRGDLVSRPIGDVLNEARALFESGVKELLVISQDTSAYGVDVKYRTGFWDGKPVKTRMTDLVERLGELAEHFGAWVRLHYVYPYPHVDEILPMMAAGRVLPYLDVPFQHAHPDVLKRMKRPANGEKNLERCSAGARLARRSWCARPSSLASPARPRPSSRTCSTSCERPASTGPAALPTRRSKARARTRWPAPCPRPCARNAGRASWRSPRRCRPRSCASASAPRCRC